MKNPHTQALIRELKTAAIESEAALWKRIATDLERPTRRRTAVNLFSIDLNAKDGETVVVAGKVLAEGELTKKVTVAALSFSAEAKRKIDAKGKTMTLNELLSSKTKPSQVRILG